MKESNVIIKPWRDDYLKIGLVYPNSYSAMAGLTIQTLYNMWNSHPNIICERFFLPSPEFSLTDSKQLKGHRSNKKKQSISSSLRTGDDFTHNHPGQHQPMIRSLENNMPLVSFDIIAVSLCYEMDYPNLCWILENSHIPVFRKDRINATSEMEELIDSKNYPLILVGGHVIRSNPLPIDSIFDAAFIGEIEPMNEKLIEAWFSAKDDISNTSYLMIQNDFLKSINKLRGFWIPWLRPLQDDPHISRVYVKNLDLNPHPISQIIPHFSSSESNSLPFGESLFVEVNRGCPHFCRFCMTGSQIKPFRNRSLSVLQNIIQKGLTATKVKKVVLIGSSVTDHPQFLELCNFLIDLNIEFSIPSIRIETLTLPMAKALVKGGMRTVAVAPETGSDRLRKTINKRISNLQILKGAKILLDAGIPNIKLYILYGLPHENDSDLDAIVSLAKSIAKLGYGKSGVRLSVNPFIPKSHTPYESSIELYLDAKMTRFKEKLARIYVPLKGDKQIKFETLPLEEAYLQTLFSLGDSSFVTFIYECYQHGLSIKKWYRFAKAKQNAYAGLHQDYLQKVAESSFGGHPWNFIDQNLPLRLLQREFEKSFSKDN
ncbi:radical SAM protein [Candidatus Lokiarchaeum ossiferum]|uniref:radical SAM protein n=1 Tax=Candidatus Lokiarchaeum ossiferum TaxID=2951803 RepID=UPI00352D456B